VRCYCRPDDVWYRWFAWRPIWMPQHDCWVWLEWIARRGHWFWGRHYRFLLAASYDDDARDRYRWRWSRRPF